MSIKPEHLLAFAFESHKVKSEIAHRTAISKAYYASFHKALSVYKFKFPKNESTHKSFSSHLQQHPDGSLERKLGLRLKIMHARRCFADYDIYDRLPPSNIIQQLSAAQSTFNELDAAFPPIKPSLKVIR